MVDGCINDVNFKTIIDKNIKDDDFDNTIPNYCYYSMLQLLNKIITKFNYNPEVKVIVTGYYKAFSQYTDMSLIPESVKEEFDIQDSDKEWLAQRWQLFRDTSTTDLEYAVLDANQDLDKNQIFLAVPDFRDENALFASNSYLWGATEDTTGINHPAPVDDVKDARIKACDELYSFIDTARYACRAASLAHPNRAGAQAYAQAIKSLLPEVGLPTWIASLTPLVTVPEPIPIPEPEPELDTGGITEEPPTNDTGGQ